MILSRSDIPQGTYPTEKNIDGATGAGPTLDQLGTEAALDIQASWPLIWPQKVVMFQTDDEYIERSQTHLNSPFLGFYNSTSKQQCWAEFCQAFFLLPSYNDAHAVLFLYLSH